MKIQCSFKLLPAEAGNENIVKQYIASSVTKKITSISGYKILKKSIDARGKIIYVNLTLIAFIDEPFSQLAESKGQLASGTLQILDVTKSSKSVIVILCIPTLINVPTIARTILRRKRSAVIVKVR